MNPIVDEQGTVSYRNENDQLHRTDGPAIITAYRYKAWYENDKLHRTNGPAVIYPDGSQFWYQNGLLHRDDGPAIIHANGYQSWYQNGEKVEEPFRNINFLKEGF